jgi:dolichol kinase
MQHNSVEPPAAVAPVHARPTHVHSRACRRLRHLPTFVPDLPTLLAVTPLALLYAAAAAAFVAWLSIGRKVRAPYTRKAFHFLILTVAMLVHLRWGAGGVVVFGSVVSLLVMLAVVRGDGFGFYEALARRATRRRTLFILVPLFTTAVGGILANLLFPAWAHVGYMVVAWGDAVGEPVGTRWGRHQLPCTVTRRRGRRAIRRGQCRRRHRQHGAAALASWPPACRRPRRCAQASGIGVAAAPSRRSAITAWTT